MEGQDGGGGSENCEDEDSVVAKPGQDFTSSNVVGLSPVRIHSEIRVYNRADLGIVSVICLRLFWMY
jgi:hypothetical protein